MWGSKFCFAVFGCKQAFIIQRYTTCQMDVWYNLYFSKRSKTKAILNQWRVFLKQQKCSRFSPFFKILMWSFVVVCFFFLSFLNYWLNSLDQAVLDVHVWHRWSGHNWDFFLDALNESVFTQTDEFASFERLTKTGNIAKTRKEDWTSTFCRSFE